MLYFKTGSTSDTMTIITIQFGGGLGSELFFGENVPPLNPVGSSVIGIDLDFGNNV